MRYIPVIRITDNKNHINGIYDQIEGKTVLLVKDSEASHKIASLWNQIGATWQGDLDPLGLDTPLPPAV